MINNENLQLDADYTQVEYQEAEPSVVSSTVAVTGTAVLTINGTVTGPNVTLSGGSSGFSYAAVGTTTLNLVSPLTTKGDIYTWSSSGTRLAVGANGTVLTADSTQTTGLRWATAAAGTVTSFSATPSGIFDVANATTTPALSLDNQNANIVLAGPSSGGAATPGFRALVAADTSYISASQSILGASFTLSSASGTFDATGLSVSLPAAGTYLLFADVRSAVTGNAGTFWFVVAKLRNTTDAADVANSETLVTLAGTTAVLTQDTAPISIVMTVAGAKTIELYASRNTSGGGSFTTSEISSDASGRSRLSYLRIA